MEMRRLQLCSGDVLLVSAEVSETWLILMSLLLQEAAHGAVWCALQVLRSCQHVNTDDACVQVCELHGRSAPM